MKSRYLVGGSGGEGGLDYEFHFTADDVVESGGLVSRMYDQGSNGNDARQDSGSLYPSYNASDSDFNNKPSLIFASDGFGLTYGAPVNYRQGCITFYAIATDGTSAARGNLLNALGSNISRTIMYPDINRVDILANDGWNTLNTRLQGSWSNLSPSGIMLIASDGTTISAYWNGSLIDTATASSNSVYTELGQGGGTFKLADIRHKNQYDLSEINSIGNELATKYGFTWTTIV